MKRNYKILLLNRQTYKDPVLIEACKKLFDWANTMGLNSQKTTNLRFIFNENEIDPLNQMVEVWCDIENEQKA